MKHKKLLTIWGWLNSPTCGLLLLGAAFAFGLTKVVYGRFVDEADNITLGWLITEGYSLYGDVFSHHFPFAYYWVALVVKLFGTSFIAVRVSMIVLQTILLAISMRTTRFYLATGLTAVVWSLTNQFQRGQEAIYASFTGLFITAVFIILIWLLVQRPAIKRLTLAWIGVLLGLSVLTSPMMVYPAGAALLALLASGRSAPPGERLRLALQRLFWTGSAAALVVAVFAAQLAITRTADDFYQQAILFNSNVYAKYVDADPNRLDRIGANLLSGLDILNPEWRRYTSPFLPLSTYRSVEMANEVEFSKWIFSSLLFRASILVCTLGLLLRRKLAAAVFLYVFAATLLAHGVVGFYSIGFSLVSIWTGFFLLLNLLLPGPQTLKLPFSWVYKISQAALLGAALLIGLMYLWLALRGGYYIADHWYWISNDRHVKMYRNLGDGIHKATCGQDVELAVYPINPIVYFVTGIHPASRYVFMYPWVAEVGQKTLIEELRQNPAAVVWINTARKSDSPGGAVNYMAETLQFLEQSYLSIGTDFWISPELANNCKIDPSQIPNITEGEAD